MKKIILIFIVLTTLISLVIAQEESVEAESSWSWNNLDDEQRLEEFSKLGLEAGSDFSLGSVTYDNGNLINGDISIPVNDLQGLIVNSLEGGGFLIKKSEGFTEISIDDIDLDLGDLSPELGITVKADGTLSVPSGTGVSIPEVGEKIIIKEGKLNIDTSGPLNQVIISGGTGTFTSSFSGHEILLDESSTATLTDEGVVLDGEIDLKISGEGLDLQFSEDPYQEQIPDSVATEATTISVKVDDAEIKTIALLKLENNQPKVVYNSEISFNNIDVDKKGLTINFKDDISLEVGKITTLTLPLGKTGLFEGGLEMVGLDENLGEVEVSPIGSLENTVYLSGTSNLNLGVGIDGSELSGSTSFTIDNVNIQTEIVDSELGLEGEGSVTARLSDSYLRVGGSLNSEGQTGYIKINDPNSGLSTTIFGAGNLNQDDLTSAGLELGLENSLFGIYGSGEILPTGQTYDLTLETTEIQGGRMGFVGVRTELSGSIEIQRGQLNPIVQLIISGKI